MLEYKAENIHLNFTGLHKQFDSQELKTYPILMSDLKTNWFVSHLHHFFMVDYEFEILGVHLNNLIVKNWYLGKSVSHLFCTYITRFHKTNISGYNIIQLSRAWCMFHEGEMWRPSYKKRWPTDSPHYQFFSIKWFK